ncbi:hypothetical protein [Streptomyces sp. NPDC008150]|uniref:hypothetical protein n=1 Tax=Streptomyces sp. NPDC008150 TaxID=3364816 RepID=UPI0036F0ADFF
MDDVVFMVRAKTRAACERELARLCTLLDARPATLPTDAAGNSWVARAVPAASTAADSRGRNAQG